MRRIKRSESSYLFMCHETFCKSLIKSKAVELLAVLKLNDLGYFLSSCSPSLEVFAFLNVECNGWPSFFRIND